jgi:hypothetical protein
VLNAPEPAREPKASRLRVWQAADRILRSGRRPTVEGVRELLGGGSPNSVTSYLNDWYRELGTRLESAEAPLAGLPAAAVTLLTELWRLANAVRGEVSREVEDDASARLWETERGFLEAQAKALETLNQELQRHRASAEKSLAETRALLARREAALDEERSRTASLDQAFAQARLDLEVALERQRIAPARAAAPTRSRKIRKRLAAKVPRESSRRATRIKRANPKSRSKPSRRPPMGAASRRRHAKRKRK